MTKINDARRSLVRAKESAEARLVELEDERRETKSTIKSLDAAIRTLGLPTKKVRNDGSPASSKSRATGKGPTH